MTDELLTPDNLRDIEARAEALEKLFPSTVYPHRDPDIYYSVVDAWGDAIFSVTPRFLGPEDVEAARNAIFEAATDIPALLAHIRAQDAALARLREALVDTQRLAWQLEHDGPRYYERKQSPYGEYLKCMYCGEISADAGEFRHTEECPVRRLYEMKDARALLDGGE